MYELIPDATLETLIMVISSIAIGLIGGIPLGIILFSTAKHGLSQNLTINYITGLTINIIRSIPYIILIVALIPLTRLIIGTSIGTAAATVPLSLASIVLIARVAEESFRIVPKGLIEAALAMGASKLQVIYKVLFPEALPNLISGVTIVIINVIGYAAMAGAVGGGGLGDLAIREGYQRYNMEVTIAVVLILIALVQIIQLSSDFIIKRMRK